MYKTILVPLDMSKRAEAIFPHVEELASCMKAKVVLLYVIEPPLPTYDVYLSEADLVQRIHDEKMSAAQAYLAARQNDMQGKGIAAEMRVESGNVVESIIKVADEIGADLIAMASHGRGGLGQVFYGSVAAGILHRVNRPLLLIRSMKEHEQAAEERAESKAV